MFLFVCYNGLSFLAGGELVPRRIAKKVVKAEDKQSHDYEMVLIISPG